MRFYFANMFWHRSSKGSLAMKPGSMKPGSWYCKLPFAFFIAVIACSRSLDNEHMATAMRWFAFRRPGWLAWAMFGTLGRRDGEGDVRSTCAIVIYKQVSVMCFFQQLKLYRVGSHALPRRDSKRCSREGGPEAGEETPAQIGR